ncbi:MAG: phosphopantetheine-binding protein [Bdellovibrionota bacterium]
MKAENTVDESRRAQLESELKQFIIQTLALEEVTPEDIPSDRVLFGEGLGLDSVDALELAVALQKKYGVAVDPKDKSTVFYFTNVKNLAELVLSQQS